MSNRNRSSTERPSAISYAKVLIQEGGFAVILPPTTSANVVRDCQNWIKKELKEERDRLAKFGKSLDINKFRDTRDGTRGIVVAVSQKVKQNPKKLVLDPDPFAHSGDRPTKFTQKELVRLREAGLTLKTFDKPTPQHLLTNTWLPGED